uniref:Uncharacterized protein n=1 Tax=Rhizophora mucronata TaxID=61149 RepID=A0A2P2JE04_RHIMU
MSIIWDHLGPISGRECGHCRFKSYLVGQGCARDSIGSDPRKAHGARSGYTFWDSSKEMDEIDWEDGSSPILDSMGSHSAKGNKQMTNEDKVK